MIVRSYRWFDAAVIVGFGALIIGLLHKTSQPSFYVERCSGRTAWFCELAQAAEGLTIFSFNPIILALVAPLVIFLSYCFRRLISGISACRIEDQVLVPGLWSIQSVRIADVASVELKTRLFGSMATINIATKDGKRLSAANGNVKNAVAFVAELKALAFASEKAI